ncbi:7705_t:CDS:1, partial [Entrophospora sp. SA101]
LSNNKRNHAGNRPFSEVCTHFTKGDEKTKGHYQATCKYCHQRWDRAYPSRLEIHLANQCIEFQRSFVVSTTNSSFGTVIEFRQ